jgi:hypothetical protein
MREEELLVKVTRGPVSSRVLAMQHRQIGWAEGQNKPRKYHSLHSQTTHAINR